eukprot:TRINITY_DN2433_c0_g1_i3.p1 TRINITY_DN2433_c0_g1~~TRINITY_DN2433_c0_g1_i3.p1  ORF type:complete len:472 (-),score=36.67 TRINITY_DN2433_c0_g1_i3:23-1438(-)
MRLSTLVLVVNVVQLLVTGVESQFVRDQKQECGTDEKCFSQPNLSYKSILDVKAVEVRLYPGKNQEFAEEVARLGRPVVVKSEMLRSKWKAIGKWSNSYMISAMCPGSILHPVYITRNHTFWLYRSHNEIYNWDNAPRPYDQTNMTVADFFLRLHDPENHGHFYYSEPVSRLTDALAEDVSPTNFLSPFPHENREITQPIWMGSRGVTTQLHYDTNYNFHVQIDGKKSFVLFPPPAMQKVYLFPRIHPHFRRSQVNLDLVDQTKFGTFSAEFLRDIVEVTLESGDALYIPPFWGHHVTNIDGGVSVNVWTENTEFKSWSADIFKRVLSVPKNVAPSDRLRAYGYFLRVALKHLKLDIKKTVEELVTQRYSPLLDVTSASPRASLAAEDTTIFASIKESMGHCRGRGSLPEAWTKQLKPKASQVAEQFMTFKPDHFAEDIRKIVLFDYLDISGLSAVQNHHNLVAEFFSQCF